MHTKTTNLCQYYVISMISVSISIFKKIINICNGLVMLIFFVFFLIVSKQYFIFIILRFYGHFYTCHLKHICNGFYSVWYFYLYSHFLT